MATMTLTGRLVRANKALARLVGRSIDDLVGMPYIALAQDLSTETMRDALTAHADGNDVVQIEHDARVGGSVRRFSATIAVARDSKQRPLYLFLQVQDISAQRAGRGGAAHERGAVRAARRCGRGLCDLHARSRWATSISWNSGAQRAKGYSADEIIGKHFRTFYPPDKQAVPTPRVRARDRQGRGSLRGGGLARPQGRQHVLGQRGHLRGARRDRTAHRLRQGHPRRDRAAA